MKASVKVLVEKELWALKGNPSMLLLGLGLILFVTLMSSLVPPTPQSSYAARHQILSNPALFGLNDKLIHLLGDWTVRFGLLVAQNPLTFGILIYVTTYSYVTNSFVSERINKTMEVLFAAPVSETDVVASKMITGVILGVSLFLLSFLANTLAIEFIFHHCTGLWWTPTRGYLLLMAFFPPAFLSLAFPLALIVGMRGSKFLMASGTFVIFVPIVLLILASQVSVEGYFRLIFWVAVASVILAVLVTLAARKMVNRLAFITN
ncbi:ABC-2 transporter permease [Thermococcus prieurii]